MLEKERIDEQRSELKKRLERQRKENAMPMIRAAVRDSCNWSRSHHSDDEEMDRNRYDDDGDYDDDHFDHQVVKNYRRTNRPREELDTDWNGGHSKLNSNRQPRNFQVNIFNFKTKHENIVTYVSTLTVNISIIL